MDETRAVYEERAAEWRGHRRPKGTSDAAEVAERAERFATERHRAGDPADDLTPGPVVDLGCGPGWYGPDLGPRVVAVDNAFAMLQLARDEAPHASLVQADLGALPFRRGSLGGAFANKSYVHLARADVPVALADLHRCLPVGGPAFVHVFTGDLEHDELPSDDFPGRRFSLWPEGMLRDVIDGAGFSIDRWSADAEVAHGGTPRALAHLTRERTLPDTVGPDMRLLVCGLNPSVNAADAGVGFAGPGNRFWPSAIEAGLVKPAHARNPFHALRHHGIGMTDLVKRATPRADALSTAEYRAGLARIERLCTWLRPASVCFVGLAGWRAAADRRATAGPQDRTLGPTPVYLMPSTSGLNAGTSAADLTTHLRAALALGTTGG